ncbi:putative methylase [Buchnera aphidicola str. Bp (Baizongia pistaciae)]|uniref:Ribosomal RNA small subunit methyltransferase D n=1 Tax=Buchnera aphidicola subsp. Baizongia pistaciae (strain Bp) TaxID=224915 RepID=RSMD_BUCBP|nr:16S rRNA (guanine(966)-N(2))-methyltransferase RsmD [Buchnera aphidicola]Q89B29.1 RecName: Full=Ribosomal RNA small subunit methyltransferase D; AltName: Full=16S rRNA m2G966 methyltransferase; AltName: Full=rRNA (guanine-N(2)-)-methyltransferase [Buchnera aphidicola str. Bp (Baizongia pistaciae)]AAO26768.1 putative methylase [Buchnera aphidicola str. Bp (Baizongia pistaciae)]
MKILKKKSKITSIQIISGKYKNSRIPIINTKNLRPTTNYIRETLFNWISNEKIKKSHCLDCFSGSGALGIEAVSRYALSSTCIEIQKKAIFFLKKILIKLSITNVHVIRANTIQWLKKPNKSYDIIFLDPPFKTTLLKQTIALLIKNNWLKNNALIYIEQENTLNKLITPPNNWILKKEKKTKKIHYSLYMNVNNF